MGNYFMIYGLDLTTKEGQKWQNIADIKDNRHMVKGFETKAAMKKFYEENINAFSWYRMLKPIS